MWVLLCLKTFLLLVGWCLWEVLEAYLAGSFSAATNSYGLVARFVALEMNVAGWSVRARVVLVTTTGVAKVGQTQCSYGKQDLHLRDLQLQTLELLYGCLGAKMSSLLPAEKLLVAGSEEDITAFSSQNSVCHCCS